MNKTNVAFGLVFLAGCVAASVARIPPARADALIERRWEYFCLSPAQFRNTVEEMNHAGMEGWELVTYASDSHEYCFKRPR